MASEGVRYVICYDVPDQRRRTKLAKCLDAYGDRVQYSVFECLLDEKGLARMKKAVMRAIRPRVDRVRFYYLCRACLAHTEVTSGVEVLSDEPITLVV